jgi:transketolase
MAMAPVAYTLWQKHLRYDPLDPAWPDRDRFVLSIGHASMLIYSLLHLAGVRAVSEEYKALDELAVPLDEIKRFRQLESRCPGHPEYRLTSGIETTTGPLGQGYANSVGMAIAAKWQATRYNRPGFDLFTHHIYALGGDGCMMEGLSHEAASLAGHLKLDNLCWIYDNNGITIEGHTHLAFSEDIAKRFAAYGWNVTHVADANDCRALDRAYQAAKETKGRPTLIIVDSHIGYGAPNKQDSHSAHGEPLGVEEIKLAKRFYGWPEDSSFLVPEGVTSHFTKTMGARGASLRAEWMEKLARYRNAHPDLANELDLMQRRQLPEGWDKNLPSFPADPKGMAGRDASQKVLNAIAQTVPWLMGGSADLAPSTKTRLTFEGAGDFGGASHAGRNFHFGIREHAMGAVINGMSLSRVRPYGSGFLIFSDYGKAPIRLAAIMEIPVVYVFTHDSIGVGEDGPTHQPIEQLAALRAIPGLVTIRPADANEVVEAWRFLMPLRHEPVALALTRQAMPVIDRTKYAAASGLARGAYVLADCEGGKPEVILIGTGSEVSVCLAAHEMLVAEGIRSRVVSMPSFEIFERQTQEYRDAVLPPSVEARISVEMGSTFGWRQYVGARGRMIGMKSFGASAPLGALLKHFGFTRENVAETARELIGGGKRS